MNYARRVATVRLVSVAESSALVEIADVNGNVQVTQLELDDVVEIIHTITLAIGGPQPTPPHVLQTFNNILSTIGFTEISDGPPN